MPKPKLEYGLPIALSAPLTALQFNGQNYYEMCTFTGIPFTGYGQGGMWLELCTDGLTVQLYDWVVVAQDTTIAFSDSVFSKLFTEVNHGPEKNRPSV